MTRGIEGSKKDIANAGLQQQVRNRRIEFSPSNRCGEGGGLPNSDPSTCFVSIKDAGCRKVRPFNPNIHTVFNGNCYT